MIASELLADFEKRSGYAFKDGKLLNQALTHSSQSTSDNHHNERLEFLGDRVLALVISQALFERFPDASEGEMALRLNRMVRKETCAEVARDLDLGKFMKSLAHNAHIKNDIFESQNVLGDACEAVLAAVYIDGGLDNAEQLIHKYWSQLLSQNAVVQKDPKSALQEWALGQGMEVPEYTEVSRQGPDHAPVFVMSVKVANSTNHSGTANSKRAAEQCAAQAFLEAENIEY